MPTSEEKDSTLTALYDDWFKLRIAQRHGQTTKQEDARLIELEQHIVALEMLMPAEKSAQLSSWTDGMQDAIKIVERRLEHYERYRHSEMAKTNPAVFAILEEILIFMRGALARGMRGPISAHEIVECPPHKFL